MPLRGLAVHVGDTVLRFAPGPDGDQNLGRPAR
jgi:hypothetical protein